MNIHNNARLTFRGREILVKRIVEQGLRVEDAAQASGVSVRTAYKWLRIRILARDVSVALESHDDTSICL
mgnify:CR=1 FL=1